MQPFNEIRTTLEKLSSEHVLVVDGSSIFTVAHVLDKMTTINNMLEDNLIGVQGKKTGHYICALLAVMGNGRTALILPETTPMERRQKMVKNSGCNTVVSSDDTCFRSRIIDETIPPNKDHGCGYQIYTSGSTGEPKGVNINIGAVIPVIQQQIELFGYNSESKTYLFPNISFDASISDILCTILAGGTIYVNEEIDRDPSSLVKYMNENNITHIDFPPSLLKLYRLENVSSLETVILGGETPPYIEVIELAEHCDVHVVYGPTEVSICTSSVKVDEKWVPENIGKPLDGNEYLISQDDGELLIISAHMMDGYIGNEELTKSRMEVIPVEHPHDRACMKYAFKTGDAVEYIGLDHYQFKGRIDRQFKKSGALVCPEEIEALVNSAEGVVNSYAGLNSGNINLIYEVDDLVNKNKIYLEISDIIRETLPPHMHPSTYRCAEIILNQNNKVDLKAMQAYIECEFKYDNGTSIPDFVGEENPTDLVSIINRYGYSVDGATLINELHIDSVDIISICLDAEKVGIDIKHTDIFESKRIDAIGGSSEVTKTNRNPREALINFNTRRLNKKALVFGANGNLGSLIVEKLKMTGYEVTCVGRRGCSVTAEFDENGVIKVEKFRKIKFSVVVNAMAIVNDIAPYEMLEAINVKSAIAIASLGQNGTEVIHISSLSVHSGFIGLDRDADLRFDESKLIPSECRFVSGYVESKWLADYMINHMSYKTKIVRLGLLTPPTTNVSFDGYEDSFLYNVLKLMKEDNAIAKLPNRLYQIDITPVNLAAQTIVNIINGDSDKEYFNVTFNRRYDYTDGGYNVSNDTSALKHMKYLPIGRANQETCIFELSEKWKIVTLNTRSHMPMFSASMYDDYIEELEGKL